MSVPVPLGGHLRWPRPEERFSVPVAIAAEDGDEGYGWCGQAYCVCGVDCPLRCYCQCKISTSLKELVTLRGTAQRDDFEPTNDRRDLMRDRRAGGAAQTLRRASSTWVQPILRGAHTQLSIVQRAGASIILLAQYRYQSAAPTGPRCTTSQLQLLLQHSVHMYRQRWGGAYSNKVLHHCTIVSLHGCIVA